MSAMEALTPEAVRKKIIRCTRCQLSARPGILPVPFRGPVDANIMILGEAPGSDENDQRKPFVGASGRLLHKLLGEHGIDMDECFIANRVSCFSGSRPPVGSIEACRIHLRRQIEICSAEWILVLGGIALTYFDPDLKVLSCRGQWWRWKQKKIFITVHPSYALRNPEGHNMLEADLAKFAKLVERKP